MLTTGHRRRRTGLSPERNCKLAQREAEPVDRHKRPKQRRVCGACVISCALRPHRPQAISQIAATQRSVAPACRSKTSMARAPMATASCAIVEEGDKGRGQIFPSRDAQRIGFAQAVGDGGEVGVVRSHHDGHAELRRLQRIVPAGRNQAAADERDARQRVDRSQLADACRAERFRRDEARRAGLRLPLRPPAPRICPISPAASRRRRTAQDGAAREPSPACGSAASIRGHASSSTASSPSSVLPATTNRSPAVNDFRSRVASASSRSAHVELEIAGNR